MHSVVFENCENSWKNALPLGNGCFGAMAFWQNNCLSLPMNHYEVYYNIAENVLPKDQLRAKKICEEPGAIYKSHYDRALRNQPQGEEPFFYFRLDKENFSNNSTARFISGSHPSTGELELKFSKEVKGADSLLVLKTEEAKVHLALTENHTGERLIEAETFVAREDVLVTRLHQKHIGLLEKVKLVYQECRDQSAPEVTYVQIDAHTFAYRVHMLLSGTKPFDFAGILHLSGASGSLENNEITICEAGNDIILMTGIFTEWRHKDPLQEGISKMEAYVASMDTLEKEHHCYWQEFFGRSGICIPDKFLERVYYINQYALDCSSGRDGVMKHHACGLNGLWDIRHPNLWGSRWYWDVNIQAAFAGVFSSNRLELGKVFSDGLLSYVELAERFAHDVHNLPGAGMDYPYPCYYSIWPWCAQYMWFQYEYSQDKEYLRKDAYPLFLKLCRFAVEVFRYDEKRGEYVVFPDISPEQGPLAHNTVITVASVKYLMKFTLEAARILGHLDEECAVPDWERELLTKCSRLYAGLPEYPTVTDDYGRRFLDSEDAPANLWIRHPSMLMPIFPTGEIHLGSDPELIETARNTITFLEEHCELGVFQVSWLAAASARLGNGQKALRLLYEMGLDHLLRSNGLAAEENERFMNGSLTIRQPLYYPCMMEFTGEMLAAVNEMLLQSDNEMIRIFPAMPDGNPEYDRAIRQGYSLHEYDDRCVRYPAWKNVSFEKLLAKGAFEVSARLEESQIAWIRINSRVGGMVNITSPFSMDHLLVCCEGQNIPFEKKDHVLSFETEAGKEYDLCIGAADVIKDTIFTEIVCTEDEMAHTVNNGVLSHMSYTRRRIFIGENPDTAYYKSIDSFLRDWYLGNRRMENHTVYKFDLGGSNQKDYSKEFYRQSYAAGKKLLIAMDFIRLDELAFSVKRGYGFDHSEGLCIVDRGAPDELRRDFVEGEESAVFYIDAPRGQYELLAVSGDACEESVTVLEAIGGRQTGGEVIKAGQYQCSLIPIIHETDGKITLKISGAKGYKWKLNLLLLNLYKQF